VRRGREVFPPLSETYLGRLRGWWRDKTHYVWHRYDRAALERLLTMQFGDRLADSGDVARSFQDHVARCSDMMSLG